MVPALLFMYELMMSRLTDRVMPMVLAGDICNTIELHRDRDDRDAADSTGIPPTRMEKYVVGVLQ